MQVKFVLPQSKVDKKAHLAGYFKFTIEKKIAGEDLIVMVKGREDFTHSPSLYISQNDTTVPSGYGADDYSCGNLGVDICAFPSKRLKIGYLA